VKLRWVHAGHVWTLVRDGLFVGQTFDVGPVRWKAYTFPRGGVTDLGEFPGRAAAMRAVMAEAAGDKRCRA
jgi:hypothetical protein